MYSVQTSIVRVASAGSGYNAQTWVKWAISGIATIDEEQMFVTDAPYY